MVDPAEVCVLVPTYDEAETIGEVVDRFREQGYGNVLVVDGGSTDGTRAVAEDHGARVMVQSGSGKGQAVREALESIDAPTLGVTVIPLLHPSYADGWRSRLGYDRDAYREVLAAALRSCGVEAEAG